MRLWEFAVRRWQFTLLLFGLLLGMGYSTLKNIPRAEDPEFHSPVPIVVVSYPGADPADIERLIVDPLEDAISELDDIKRMDSRSLDGVGIIQVEFEWDQDADEKYDEVVREVNRVRSELPADIANLEVRRTGSGLVNIMQVALVSADATYRELDELGRALSDQIETLPGVRRSEVFALPKPEVRIAIDLERMGRAGRLARPGARLRCAARMPPFPAARWTWASASSTSRRRAATTRSTRLQPPWSPAAAVRWCACATSPPSAGTPANSSTWDATTVNAPSS